jgi:hypothetical protein
MNAIGTSFIERIAASVHADTVSLTLQPWRRGATPLTLISVGNEAEFRAQVGLFVYANHYAGDPGLFDVNRADHMVLLGYRLSNRAFLDELKAANPGHGYSSAGWRIRDAQASGEIKVERAGLTLVARRERHLLPAERSAAIGDVVSVRFPADSVGGSPGYYLAYSDAGPAGGAHITRFYLNLRPSRASALNTLLRLLLDAGIPYTLKVLVNPEEFARRDNTVLYVARSDYETALGPVCAFHRSHRTAFRRPVPGFTLPLLPGVAVADNPDSALPEIQSFGEHRSSLVGSTIATLAIEGAAFEPRSLHDALLQRFRAEGMDAARPYLNRFNGDDYARPDRLVGQRRTQ